MVWFTFTFLLGIPNNNAEKVKTCSTGNNEKKIKEIEVSKPNFLCHIEYILFPSEVAKFIDVVCWDEAAKIYFEDSTSAIIPFKVGKLLWIHFRVNHKITLRTEEVPLFYSHNVKFNITIGNKKFGEPAKSDKPKKFYAPNFPNEEENYFIKRQIFQPLSETEEDLPAVSFIKEHLTARQQLYISLDTTIETSENFKTLHKALIELSNEYHDDNVLRVPTRPYEDAPRLTDLIKPNEYNLMATAVKKVKNNKTEGKSTSKTQETDKLEFGITGEEFFSGKKFFKNCLKYNSENLPFVLSFCAVKNLLSISQTKLFNPLSIKLSSLYDMPVNQLEKIGVTKLKFRFVVCDRIKAESNLIPIESRMKLNYTRTIFTNALDKQQLIYLIQITGLRIEVLGNANSESSALEDVLLGTVSVDISSILLQPHRVLLKCNFQISNESVLEKKENEYFTTINEFNCGKEKRNIQFFRFFDITPVLTVRVGLGHSLTSALQAITMNPDLINRLFAIFYNKQLAIPIIRLIQDEVDVFLGFLDYSKNGKNVKRPLTVKNEGSFLEFESNLKIRMTGFVVDCSDKIILYVESPPFAGVQKVWSIASCTSPQEGYVLYDSSLIFLSRLYAGFFKFGGFIAINLQKPFESFLLNSRSYSGNVPKPAWRALRCLSLLTNCKSIKTAAQNNLFPDLQSLCSLALEFGVPLRFYDKKII